MHELKLAVLTLKNSGIYLCHLFYNERKICILPVQYITVFKNEGDKKHIPFFGFESSRQCPLVLLSEARLIKFLQLYLNNIQEFSPYLTRNTFHLCYKVQPINAVWGNSRCFLWKPYGTHKYTSK
jgi:hypothetical protein